MRRTHQQRTVELLLSQESVSALEKLGTGRKRATLECLNRLVETLRAGEQPVGLHRMLVPVGGSDSSCKAQYFTMRIDSDLRTVLTIDEDPLFGRWVVKLWRVLTHARSSEDGAAVVDYLARELGQEVPRT